MSVALCNAFIPIVLSNLAIFKLRFIFPFFCLVIHAKQSHKSSNICFTFNSYDYKPKVMQVVWVGLLTLEFRNGTSTTQFLTRFGSCAWIVFRQEFFSTCSVTNIKNVVCECIELDSHIVYGIITHSCNIHMMWINFTCKICHFLYYSISFLWHKHDNLGTLDVLLLSLKDTIKQW